MSNPIPPCTVRYISPDDPQLYDSLIQFNSDSVITSQTTLDLIHTHGQEGAAAEPQFEFDKWLSHHRLHVSIMDNHTLIFCSPTDKWSSLPSGAHLEVSTTAGTACVFCSLALDLNYHSACHSSNGDNSNVSPDRGGSETFLTTAESTELHEELRVCSGRSVSIVGRLIEFANQGVQLSKDYTELLQEKNQLETEVQQWKNRAQTYLPALRDRDSRMLIEHTLGKLVPHDNEECCSVQISGWTNVIGGRQIPQYRRVLAHCLAGCTALLGKSIRAAALPYGINTYNVEIQFDILSNALHFPGEPDAFPFSFPSEGRAVRIRDLPLCRALGQHYVDVYKGKVFIVVNTPQGIDEKPMSSSTLKNTPYTPRLKAQARICK